MNEIYDLAGKIQAPLACIVHVFGPVVRAWVKLNSGLGETLN